MHSSAALDEDSYVVCGRLILFVNLGISIFSIYTSSSCQWYSITPRSRLAHLWLPCIVVLRHSRLLLATFLINQMIQKTSNRKDLIGLQSWFSYLTVVQTLQRLHYALLGFLCLQKQKKYNYDELATYYMKFSTCNIVHNTFFFSVASTDRWTVRMAGLNNYITKFKQHFWYNNL